MCKLLHEKQLSISLFTRPITSVSKHPILNCGPRTVRGNGISNCMWCRWRFFGRTFTKSESNVLPEFFTCVKGHCVNGKDNLGEHDPDDDGGDPCHYWSNGKAIMYVAIRMCKMLHSFFALKWGEYCICRDFKSKYETGRRNGIFDLLKQI